MLGTFKLDHLHPFRPILLKQISNFFTFILGSQFLLPQRANSGKREVAGLPGVDSNNVQFSMFYRGPAAASLVVPLPRRELWAASPPVCSLPHC